MNWFGFGLVDLVAIVLFFATWLAYSWLVNNSRWRDRSISQQMVAYRYQWMLNMVHREVRMVDALINSSLQQGVLFFASTSILLIGGLLAGLGATESAIRVLGDIPFSSTDTRVEWEVKIMLLVFIFMFAFFKFAWSYRLLNYVVIMIGAAPDVPKEEGPVEVAEHYAQKVAQMQAIGARHFTTGLSAYFFALSAIAWFVNGWAFIAATAWVFLVLYRRAFLSKFMKTLEL